MLNGFHRCQGFGGGGVSQAPGWLLHQLVEQNVALTGRHLVFTDRGDAGEKADGVGVGITAVDPLLPVDPHLPGRSSPQHRGPQAFCCPRAAAD